MVLQHEPGDPGYHGVGRLMGRADSQHSDAPASRERVQDHGGPPCFRVGVVLNQTCSLFAVCYATEEGGAETHRVPSMWKPDTFLMARRVLLVR